MVDVVDPMGVELVSDAGERRVRPGGLRLGRGLVDVGDREHGQGGQALGGVGELLLGAEGLHVVDHLATLLGRHRVSLRCQLGGLAVGVVLGHGDELYLGGVGVLADEFAEEPLEVAVVEPGLDVRERLLVAQVVVGVVVIVEPARHRLHRQGDPVGIAAPVALAEVELGLGERGEELVARDSAVGKLGADGLDKGAELLGDSLACALELEEQVRLVHPVNQDGEKVVREAGVEDASLEGRLVGPGDRVEEDVGRENALAVGGGAHHVGEADGGVLGRRCHVDAGETGCDRRLQRQRVGLARPARHRPAEPLVNKGELAINVEGSEEHGVGVGRRIVARVRVEEALVGERGYGAGVSAGLEAVGRVREEGTLHAEVEDVVGVRERAAHLVEDHAVVGQRRVLAVHLEVPALLLEDVPALVDCGMEHGVEVDPHEVLEVGSVGGGDRIHGLVGEGEGVQERLHRRLEQVHEGLLDGIGVGAAEHGVLEDVEDAGVVCGRRLEGDGERLVFVGAGEPQCAGARGVVAEHVRASGDFRQGLRGDDGESRMGRSHGQFGLQRGIGCAGICHGVPPRLLACVSRPVNVARRSRLVSPCGAFVTRASAAKTSSQ